MTHPSDHRLPIEARRADVACTMFKGGWGAKPGWQDVWRAHATDDMMAYFNGRPEPTKGLEAFLAFQQDLFAGFPALRTSITQVTAEGDTVVVQSVLEGAQTGSFLGVPPSNLVVKVPDVTIFRFRDERICEMRYFTDLLMVMMTIGAVRPV